METSTYNPDYEQRMVQNIKEDAAYYAGSGHVGDEAAETLNNINRVVPDELPPLRQDLSAERREKILQVRRRSTFRQNHSALTHETLS